MKETVIFNGGEPLQDCPKTWEEAGEIEKKLNNDKDFDPKAFFDSPKWSFDCGFKLDYDGPILRISSRFYPPKDHYGNNWDGSVSVYLFKNEIRKKEFCANTIDELKLEVESYVESIKQKIEQLLII